MSKIVLMFGKRWLCRFGLHRWVRVWERGGSGYWSYLTMSEHYCGRCGIDHDRAEHFPEAIMPLRRGLDGKLQLRSTR